MRNRLLALWLVVVTALVSGARVSPGHAETNCRDCEPSRFQGISPTLGTYTIGFGPGFSQTERQNIIAGTKAYWESAYFGQQASVTISSTEVAHDSATIKFEKSTDTGGNAGLASFDAGQDGGGTIAVNSSYDPNTRSADYWKLFGAHEVGHLFGFQDKNSASTGSCFGKTVMSQTMFGNMTGFPPDAWCSDQAGVFDQQQDGQYDVCAFGCPPGYSPTCVGDQQPDPGACNCCINYTPIIIDLFGDGFDFSGLADGVWFDINGTTPPIRIGWPYSSDDVWLALDRNQNGRVDNATELFGNTTILRTGRRAQNGFEALREFDDNRDGIIDASDTVFGELVVWGDVNRNAFSEPSELHSLESVGIRTIDTAFRESRRRDRWGNMFRYRGHVMTDGGWRSSADVYPVAAQASVWSQQASKR